MKKPPYNGPMSTFPDYPRHDGLGLAELVRAREVTPLELVEAALARIEAHNPALNAVVVRLDALARAAARGPLADGPFAGVPMLLKDYWATCAGLPTSDGNRMLRHVRRADDSEMARRWRAAGVIFVGKTNTPELALQPATEPAAFGPTRNPWDRARSPAGSSGGAAVAVATRMVPIAGGTDAAGSIRMPASACGLFGLKPSRGRTPSGPEHGEMWGGLGVEHVITRTVRDSAAMLDATAGPDAGAPYAAPAPARPFLAEVGAAPGRLRVAFTDRPFLGYGAHPECRAGLRATARLLAELGHEVEEEAPPVDGEACASALITVVACETRAAIVEAARLAGRPPRAADFEAATYALGLLGAATGADEYLAAWRTMRRAARVLGQFHARYDLLLTPTLASPPLPIGYFEPTPVEMVVLRVANRLGAGWALRALDIGGPMAAKLFEYMPYTPLANITGQPAMSVPLHWTADGLPLGMQFIAPYGDEATLLRLAGQLEQARPWKDRTPPGVVV